VSNVNIPQTSLVYWQNGYMSPLFFPPRALLRSQCLMACVIGYMLLLWLGWTDATSEPFVVWTGICALASEVQASQDVSFSVCA